MKSFEMAEDQRPAIARELADFKKQAWKEYDMLYAEMEFTSERAAMMHQHEASRHDQKSFYVESAAEVMGVSSVASLGIGLVRKANLLGSRLGVAGLIGLPLAVVLEFAGKGRSRTLPTLYDKADRHKKAAAGWQRLARLTQSYRILIDDPRYDAVQYAEWYKELVQAQEEISNIVGVPESTVRLFDDPKEVVQPLRQNKLLFQRYLDMQSGKEEIVNGDG
ncbi:unnamed protein product [Lymnaea stagnalis]|uniref:Uncharacterized protein n=1 Tax=Lymnaea stagnalis TaxID=6523 RepID=A0AAV2HTD9_LYMST